MTAKFHIFKKCTLGDAHSLPDSILNRCLNLSHFHRDGVCDIAHLIFIFNGKTVLISKFEATQRCRRLRRVTNLNFYRPSGRGDAFPHLALEKKMDKCTRGPVTARVPRDEFQHLGQSIHSWYCHVFITQKLTENVRVFLFFFPRWVAIRVSMFNSITFTNNLKKNLDV